MSIDNSSTVWETAIAFLNDDKLEVQVLAATSLSGILKMYSAKAAKVVRDLFIAEVARVKTGKHANISTRHGLVLGLKAFILSFPYDVPRWMPAVLMSLVSMADQPQPIKTTVSRALGEFRRTHEESSLQECRDFFDNDQWDAIQGVASTTNYFV